MSWTGLADFKSAEDDSDGAITQGVEFIRPSRVLLLNDLPANKGKAYATWLRKRTGTQVDLHQVELSDPTNLAEIYQHADRLLRELAERKDTTGEGLVIHLSPGTPAMQTVWMLLGTTRYPARLIKSSPGKGVVDAAIPFDLSFEYVEPALRQASDAALVRRTSANSPEGAQFGDIVYRCQQMEAVVSKGRRVAPRSIPVLLLGESGTGKELLARAIHAEGRGKAGGPFVPLNCGAIPRNLVESVLFGHKKGAFTGATTEGRGAFEEAQGGTLFLDELGEMPLDVQVRLLRVLQEKKIQRVGESREIPVDVRVVAATNRDLAKDVRHGRFREDLFFRLAVAVLELPPLREREGDLGRLIDSLLDRANNQAITDEPGYRHKTLSRKGRNLLLQHQWPGNVRELENTLVRAAVWADGKEITAQDIEQALLGHTLNSTEDGILRRDLHESFELRTVLDEVSKHYVERALAETGGNRTRAAKILGLKSQQVLGDWIERLRVSEGVV